jgi:arylsulfatase A-like enzyme
MERDMASPMGVCPGWTARAAAAVLAALTLAGCAGRGPESPPAAPEPDRPPNIVVFLVDTLRADRLGVYGYDRRPTSPRLDALADEAVVFERAYSTSPWTLPTVASLATSTFLCEHGVVSDRQRIAEGRTTLAEQLAEHGYLTMGLYGNAYAGPSFGLDRGFELYTFSRKNDAAKVEPLLDVAEKDGRPFYLYIHNMEPHGGERFRGPPVPGFTPEVPPELRQEMLEEFNAYRKLTRVDFARSQPLGTTDTTEAQRRALDSMTARYAEHDVLYDASIRLADERFGSVVDLLRRRGVLDDTVLVFVSDHGEELGEHGGWQHDQSVYEELIHVPLVVRLPVGAAGGSRVADTVTLVDLAPTLVGRAGVAADGLGLRGRDLSPVIARQTPREPAAPAVVAVRRNEKKFYAPWKAERGDLNIALRDGDLKAIVNVEIGTVELYDLAADPEERSDLAGRRPDDAARLAAFAGDWLSRCSGTAGESSLDDATVERLRALGYVD